MISSSSSSSFSVSVFRTTVLWCALVALISFSNVVTVVNAGALLGQRRAEKDNILGRSIRIVNESGRKCDMYWVNTFVSPEQFVPQFIEDGVSIGLSFGSDKSLSSYIGHVFEIRELPSKRGTKKCLFETCRRVRIKVSDREDQKVTLERDFTVTIQDDISISYTKADDMYKRCQNKIYMNEEDDDGDLSPLELIEEITNCMEHEINSNILKQEEERQFHLTVHRDMAAELVPFTCGDVNQTDSHEILNQTWYYKEDSRNYKIKKLHELPTSTIFTIDNFVTKDYCDALQIYRTTTNDDNEDNEKGSSRHVPLSAAFEGTKQSNLLNGLLNKIYELMLDQIDTWDDLDAEDVLFHYMKDDIGYDTPTHLCVGTEEVTNAFHALELGQPKTCQIPGGDPVVVPTKRILMEDGHKNKRRNVNVFRNNDDNFEINVVEVDEKLETKQKSKQQLADIFLFCNEPEKQILGGIHFPFARIHITPKIGKLVVAVNRKNYNNNKVQEQEQVDGYVNEYHLCPNHEVYVHTISGNSSGGGGGGGESEGAAEGVGGGVAEAPGGDGEL